MRFLKAVEKAEVQVAEAEWPDLRRPDFYINIGDEARVLRRVQLKMLAYAGANALFSHRGVSLESHAPPVLWGSPTESGSSTGSPGLELTPGNGFKQSRSRCESSGSASLRATLPE